MKHWIDIIWLRTVLGALALCIALPLWARDVQRIHEFQGPDGIRPVAELLLADDGFFYGTTREGGDAGFGTVYRTDSNGALTSLHSFDGSDGGFPEAPLLQGADGMLYGTTSAGGAAGGGTVFRLAPDGTLTTLHDFVAPRGRRPLAGLIEFQGRFYGTTTRGGRFGAGTVFRLAPDGTYRVLHSFSVDDGALPVGELLEVGGLLYGTTSAGGSDGLGTLFAISPLGSFISLHSFTGPDGANPRGALTLGDDGRLYGTTARGGEDDPSCIGGCGIVFASTLIGVVSTMHRFNFFSGSQPLAGLTALDDGRLYGTTEQGGDGCFFLIIPVGCGTLYRIDTDGGFELLADFDYGATYPAAGVTVGAEGFLYGAAAQTLLKGDTGSFGALFVLDPNPIVIDNFTPGRGPVGTPVSVFGSALDLATAVTFNGVPADFTVVSPSRIDTQVPPEASSGPITVAGPNSAATSRANFNVTIPGVALTTLKVFTLGGDGTNTPIDALIEGSDGLLYGTTLGSGTEGGSIFRLTRQGEDFTFLQQFGLDDENLFPWGGLIEASDSFLYGTTEFGGTGGGNLFQLDPDTNTLTSLYAFTGFDDGRVPRHDGLIEFPDGTLYGTTQDGGFEDDDECRFGCGTVFGYLPGVGLTTVHLFTGVDGNSSLSGLTAGADGLLYGVTSTGGAFDGGVIYKVSTNGVFTLLHDFDRPTGAFPEAKLLLASDGNFYGTTAFGGAADLGTVFRITPDGTYTLLHSFSGLDGATPLAALIRAGDGHLYGTTEGGGAYALGTVYQLRLDGTLTTYYSFQGDDGSFPDAALLQGSDGALYGTTTRGGGGGCSPGAFSCGTLFRLTLP